MTLKLVFLKQKQTTRGEGNIYTEMPFHHCTKGCSFQRGNKQTNQPQTNKFNCFQNLYKNSLIDFVATHFILTILTTNEVAMDVIFVVINYFLYLN